MKSPATVLHTRDSEWLLTNRLGGYASGTIQNLPSRRYHAYLIASDPQRMQRTTLLHSIHEEWSYRGIVRSTSAYQFSDGTIHPRGYDYLVSCKVAPSSITWRYAWDDVVLEKTLVLGSQENTCFVHYSLLHAQEPLTAYLRPLVAFRDHHSLHHGLREYTVTQTSRRTARVKADDDADILQLQSSSGTLSPLSVWFWNFYYATEKSRGLDSIEDLFVPIVVTAELRPGEGITIAASLNDAPMREFAETLDLQQRFSRSFSKKLPTKSPDWIQRLAEHASAFVVDQPKSKSQSAVTGIIAGYPWFSMWSRDTFIALPGLLLSLGQYTIAKKILLHYCTLERNGLLPNRRLENGEEEYFSADGSLLFAHALWEYTLASNDVSVLKKAVPTLISIYQHYCGDAEGGSPAGVSVDPEDSLLSLDLPGRQLTWMDAKVGDWVVTPRAGKPVEIQALWYNFLQVLLHAPVEKKNATVLARVKEHAESIRASFQLFWSDDQTYLIDCIGQTRDTSIRPNQVIACGLAFSPLSLEEQQRVLQFVKVNLYTPYGLRTLASSDARYQGSYGGDQTQRDSAYHQGTVWPWLLEFYFRGLLRQGQLDQRVLLETFETHLDDAGIGYISEIFNADSPHRPQGCIAQAWSVAAILWASLARMQQETAEKSVKKSSVVSRSKKGQDSTSKTTSRQGKR